MPLLSRKSLFYILLIAIVLCIVVIGVISWKYHQQSYVGKAVSQPDMHISSPDPAPILSGGTTTYVYGSKLVAVKTRGGLRYQFQDFLSTNSIGSDQSGVLQSRFVAYPYGKTLLKQSNVGADQRYTFTGKEDDWRLMYFGARYYDPRGARFLSIDPVLTNPSYVYVHDNPLRFVDPSGRDEVSLKQKEALLKIESMPFAELDSLSGGLGRSSLALAHYLLGSGEPKDFSLSGDEWASLIQQVGGKYGGKHWRDSRNPEYHHDQGWEYLSGVQASEADKGSGDLYNLLGETTLRRRIEDGKYHYMVVENFDFTRGDGNSLTGDAVKVLRSLNVPIDMPVHAPFKNFCRLVPEDIARFGDEYFPDVTDSGGFGTKSYLMRIDTKYLLTHGKPFRINAETYVPLGREKAGK